MSSQQTIKRKGEGPRLNDRQRMEIIALLEHPKPQSMRSIARQFGVDEKTIRKVKLAKDVVRERAQNMDQATQETTLRVSQAMFPEIEEKLAQWIDAGRRMSLVLPPMLICHKAKHIAQTLGISDDKFKASWGWFARFRHRHGLQSINLFGEGGEVDRNNPEVLKALQELSKIIDQYDPSCVYNMDETGLFYRLIPRYTVLLPTENLSTIRGKKKSMERVTLIVCCNATGTECVPITMIGKTKDPACIRGNSWPIPYFQQKNAWVDVMTFNRWFNEVFEPYVRKRTGHRVLLILDNAPGHSIAFERNGIRVVFFPPNVTSWKQPMDMGIIAAIKKRYKFLLIKEILAYHDNPQPLKEKLALIASKKKRGAAGVAYGRPPHLLDVSHLINIAWCEMTSSSLKNCFKAADIIPGLRDYEVDIESDHTVDEITNLLRDCNLLNNCLESSIRNEVEQYLNDDKDDSEFFKNALIEEIDNAMKAALIESNAEFDESLSDNEPTMDNIADIDQQQVILSSLQNVINLEVDMSELQSSPFLSSDQINQAKSALFTLRRILQSGSSAITRKQIQNSRQMSLHDFI